MILMGFPVVGCTSGWIGNEVVYGATELSNHKCWALVVRHEPIIPLIESRMKLEQRMGRILANVRR